MSAAAAVINPHVAEVLANHRASSRRRALSSYLTADEKRERRQAHAESIRAALAHVATPAGFTQWLEARELNPQLSPLSAALVAVDAPGEIVGTFPQWRSNGYRVRKGAQATLHLTGRGFWPTPAFTAAQTDAPEMLSDPAPIALPSAEVQRWMLAALVARFEADGCKTTTLNAFAESLDETPTEQESKTAEPTSDDLPF